MPIHPVPETAGLWSRGRRGLTTGLVLSVTLVAFEALAIANVMPIVAADLESGSRDLYGWVFSGFLLSSLVGIVLAGLLIDRGSLVLPFGLGLSFFAAGLLAGGLAPTMEILVAARVLQGVGAGAIPAVAYVAIGRALPETLRPRMFATLSTAWVVPGLIGPALAGAVAEAYHWRIVFLGLLPLIAVAAAMTLPALRAIGSATGAEAGREHDIAANTRRRLPAALVLAVAAGMAVAGLTDASLWPGLPLVVVGIGLGVPAFRRLTPPGTLRVERGLPAAVMLRGVLTFAFFAVDIYVPVAFQDWRGTTATEAGLALTAATLTWTGAAWIQAQAVGRLGTRRFIRTGFAVVAVGVAAFTLLLNPDVPIAVGVAAWAVAGFGMGLAYSPLSLTVLREAPPDRQGESTAGLQLSDVLGSALGAGVAGAIIAYGHRAGIELWVSLAWAFGVGVFVAAVGAVLAGRLSVGKIESEATARLPEPVTEVRAEA